MSTPKSNLLPIRLIDEAGLAAFVATLSAAERSWLESVNFKAERHRVLMLPGADGRPSAALLGLGAAPGALKLEWWQVSGLPERLPAGRYFFADDLAAETRYQACLGWFLGEYRYSRYKPEPIAKRAELQQSAADQACELARQRARAVTYARDLINTPANDLGPAELAETAAALAARFSASYRCVTGEALLAENYPLIHAVGRASVREPRLIDLHFGDERHPKVTLVGKGVCFDSGGLDIKPAAGMLLMKKDMAGAAVALALAQRLMERGAPVRLRVLIAAVENSIGGAAFRPGDVLRSRRGLTVEIGNTDAEGRLVLADALCEADDEQPDLLLNFATLTGAARVALGPDLPAVFSPDEELLQQVQQAGRREIDPVWPLPLWDAYDDELNSRIADLNNVASSAFAGAIFGALFLRRFVAKSRSWAHFDLYGWNARERPGRAVGGEAQCVRLLDRLIGERYG